MYLIFTHRLIEILEFAEDMEIDIPKIWKYLGELVGQMIQDGSVPLSFLKQAAKPLVDSPSNKAGIFVAEVLHDACHREVITKCRVVMDACVKNCFNYLPVQKANTLSQFLKYKIYIYSGAGIGGGSHISEHILHAYLLS